MTKARAFYYWDNGYNGYLAFLDVYVSTANLKIIFAHDINGLEASSSGQLQLLIPSTTLGATLPSGAVSTGEVSVVR